MCSLLCFTLTHYMWQLAINLGVVGGRLSKSVVCKQRCDLLTSRSTPNLPVCFARMFNLWFIHCEYYWCILHFSIFLMKKSILQVISTFSLECCATYSHFVVFTTIMLLKQFSHKMLNAFCIMSSFTRNIFDTYDFFFLCKV